MKTQKTQIKGIIFIIVSALLTSFGQLSWKLGVGDKPLYLIVGFILYGIGALTMILGLKYGELSVLHPLMCVGYIFALINGAVFLKEKVTALQLIGIAIIILGVVFITRGED